MKWGPSWDLTDNKLQIKKRLKPQYFILPDLSKSSFGTRLRYLRRRLGLNLEQVSKSSGLSIGAIRRLEADAHEILEPWTVGRPARIVGRRALIWEKDAEAFARTVRSCRGKRRP